MLGRLGDRDGRRRFKAQLLPNLPDMPFTQIQKAMLDRRARAVVLAPPYIHPNLNFFNPPADSEPFTITPSPFVAYPAVGSSAIVVITLTVPKSKIAVIRKLSVVHFGGNPPDGTGQVIWRVLKNGGGIRGLNQLTSQYGTYATPKDLTIVGVENDTIQVTVELPTLLADGVTPNANMPAGTRTAASFDGFTYSLSEATNPEEGSY